MLLVGVVVVVVGLLSVVCCCLLFVVCCFVVCCLLFVVCAYDADTIRIRQDVLVCRSYCHYCDLLLLCLATALLSLSLLIF